MAAGAGARPAPRWLKALGEPLSAAQLRRLEEHRYSAAGVSLLEPPLQLYWTWLLQWIPLWLAPNSITLLGLAINLLTTLVLIAYCPTVTEEAPYWTYLICALGLFIYQSLDAIDGKQARRTNSCSPLGELFDHGCDSLSTVFMAVGASIAVRLGTHPDWLFFCSFIGMFMFYCAHWQTYVSGVLRFGNLVVHFALICSLSGTQNWGCRDESPVERNLPDGLGRIFLGSSERKELSTLGKWRLWWSPGRVNPSSRSVPGASHLHTDSVPHRS